MKPRNMKAVCRDLASAIAKAHDVHGRGEMMPKTVCRYTGRVRPSQIGWIMGRPAWLKWLNVDLAEYCLKASDYDRTRRPPVFVLDLASVDDIRAARERKVFGPPNA